MRTVILTLMLAVTAAPALASEPLDLGLIPLDDGMLELAESLGDVTADDWNALMTPELREAMDELSVSLKEQQAAELRLLEAQRQQDAELEAMTELIRENADLFRSLAEIEIADAPAPAAAPQPRLGELLIARPSATPRLDALSLDVRDTDPTGRSLYDSLTFRNTDDGLPPLLVIGSE